MEICVNEYIRLETDGIGKVIEVRYSPLRYVYDVCGNIAFPYDITKHSFNIIDIIECGDYVNGEKIKEFYIEENTVTKNKRIVVKYDWDKVINDFEIKSIVTHEQFNSIKYEVD